MRVAEMGVSHFFALDPRTVAEHDVGDIASGGSGVDRPGIPCPDEARQPPDVVVVGMRDDHRIERAGVKLEPTVRPVGIDAIRVKQPTIEQNPPRIDLQKMGTARDLPGRAVERDSQPGYLPTIDRAPAGHGTCLRWATRMAHAGQLSLSRPDPSWITLGRQFAFLPPPIILPS